MNNEAEYQLIRPHKVDSQIIVTRPRYFEKALHYSLFIIIMQKCTKSSIFNIANAKNVCFSTVFNLASRN